MLEQYRFYPAFRLSNVPACVNWTAADNAVPVHPHPLEGLGAGSSPACFGRGLTQQTGEGVGYSRTKAPFHTAIGSSQFRQIFRVLLEQR